MRAMIRSAGMAVFLFPCFLSPFRVRRRPRRTGLGAKFDIEDPVGSGARIFSVVGAGVLGVIVEGDFAGLGRAPGIPVFVFGL